MAEVIAKHWFAQQCCCTVQVLRDVHGWDIRSGGLTDEYEKPGSPASANGVTAMKRIGMDLTQHRSTVLTPDDIRQATRILCVSRRHVEWIVDEVPEAASKTSTLGKDIPDPWHQAQVAYDRVAETMQAVVPEACQTYFGHYFKTA
jgi:protein-tyrosine-phosphatase